MPAKLIHYAGASARPALQKHAHYLFVLPVAKKNLRAYARIARKAGKVWREYGAIDYKECVGDDLDVKMGVPFPRQVKLKPGETVVGGKFVDLSSDTLYAAMKEKGLLPDARVIDDEHGNAAQVQLLHDPAQVDDLLVHVEAVDMDHAGRLALHTLRRREDRGQRLALVRNLQELDRVARPVAKPTPATFSICIRACSSARPACSRGLAGAA